MNIYKATFKFKNGIIGEIVLVVDEVIKAVVMISNMLSQYDLKELNIREVF